MYELDIFTVIIGLYAIIFAVLFVADIIITGWLKMYRTIKTARQPKTQANWRKQ